MSTNDADTDSLNDISRHQKRSLEPDPSLSIASNSPSPADFSPKRKRPKFQQQQNSRNHNQRDSESTDDTDDDEIDPVADEKTSAARKTDTSDRARSTTPKPSHTPQCDTAQTPTSKRASSQSPSPSPSQSKSQYPVVQKRKPGRPRRKKMPAQPSTSSLGVLDDEQEEIIGKIDELGEKKISKDGELLDGREFRIRTFLSPTRNPTRLYMFGLDAAKLLGYRDSYLFFHRNKQIKKIWTTDVEKLYLISESLLIPQLKNRPVALVTAHTIFVNFGSRVVKNARMGIDDYYETDMIGTPEWGRLLHKPLPPAPKADEGAPNSFSYGASTDDLRAGGSGSSVLILAPASPEKFKSTQPNSIDWMYQCAASTRDFNKRLLAIRKVKQASLFSGNQQTATDEKPMGFWDWHTNMHQVPRLTQCTNVRVERCDTVVGSAKHTVKNALHVEKDLKFTSPEDGPKGRVLSDNLHGGEMSRILNEYIPHALDHFVQPVEDPKEEAMRLYPLRIMDRQWVGGVSVHSTRFCKDDIVEPRPSVKKPVSADILAASVMAAGTGLTLTQPLEEYNPGMDQLSKKMAASSSIFCRYPNRIGLPCQRLVTYEGERCLYHKETAEKENDGGSTNDSVKNNEIPKAEKKPNAPATPIPEKNTTPAFVPPPNPNICVHCRCVRTPSVLVPGSSEHYRSVQPETDEATANGDDEKSGNAEKSVDANPTAANDVSLPFDLEMTIQCSKCKYRYHPLCANISSAKVIAAVVGGGSVQGSAIQGDPGEKEGESVRDPAVIDAEGSGNNGTSNSWQCNDCKVCVVCADAEDEASLLICDGCDRGWHMRCCRTEVEEVPQGRWLCSICSRCHTCNNTKLLLQHLQKGTAEGSGNAEGPSVSSSTPGPKNTPSPRKKSPVRKAQRKPPPVFPVSSFHAVQTPSDPPTGTRPTFLATYCSLCHSDFEQDHYCPVCLKTFSEEDPAIEEAAVKVIESGGWDIGMDLDTDMVCCDRCDRWVHKRCDVRMRDDRWFRKIGKKGVQYICPLCEVDKQTNDKSSDDPSDRNEEEQHVEELAEDGEKKTEAGPEKEKETDGDLVEVKKPARPSLSEYLDPKSTPHVRGVVTYKGKLIGMPAIPDGTKEVREARSSTAMSADRENGRGDGVA